MPETAAGRHRSGSDRSTARAAGAAIVAAGLVLSASLYPVSVTTALPDTPPPKHEVSEFATIVQSALANHRFVDRSELTMPDLVHLAETLSDDLLGLRADALLEMVNSHGLPDVVESLELLRSLQTLTEGNQIVFSGGGGGSGGTAAVPIDMTAALAAILGYLLELLPGSASVQLAEVITNLLPTLAQALGLPRAPRIQTPESQAFVVVESPAGPPAQAEEPKPVEAPPPETTAPAPPASVTATPEALPPVPVQPPLPPMSEVPAPPEEPLPLPTQTPDPTPPIEIPTQVPDPVPTGEAGPPEPTAEEAPPPQPSGNDPTPNSPENDPPQRAPDPTPPKADQPNSHAEGNGPRPARTNRDSSPGPKKDKKKDNGPSRGSNNQSRSGE